MKKLTLVAASALAMVAAAPASAAVVTTTYRLTASNFTSFQTNNLSPVTSIDTTFTLSYDNTADVASTSLGSTLGLASPYGDNLNFAYQKSQDGLTIGQSVRPGGLSFSRGGIAFYINNASSSPTVSSFILTVPAGNAQYRPNTFSISIVPQVTPAVPEPATWGLMLLGMGMVGAGMRTRRRSVTFSAA